MCDLPSLPFHFQSFEEVPLLTKEEVQQNPNAYQRRGLLPVSQKKTSGTTGLSLNLRRSLPALIFEQAMIDWVVNQAGHDLRSERVAVLRGDDIKALDDISPPFWRVANGHTMTFSSNHLSSQTLPHFLTALREFRPDILYAYPSGADQLARLTMAAGERLHFPLVLTSSESFPDFVRKRISDAFSTHVVDYYGQGERVAFAYSLESNRYRFHPAYGLIELIPLSDQGGAPLAKEIVGTSFHNSAQVLARYRTGDFVEIGDESEAYLSDIANGRKTFSGISGRTSEILYGPGGEVLTGLNQIPRGLEQYGRMQLIQDAPDHVEILMQSRQSNSRAATAHVLARSRSKIPSSMAIDVKFVDELVRTSAGKVPFVLHRT